MITKLISRRSIAVLLATLPTLLACCGGTDPSEPAPDSKEDPGSDGKDPTLLPDGGHVTGTPGSTCETTEARSCSQCPKGWYCEPGDSLEGIFCLCPCSTSSECSANAKCVRNDWFDSYRGNICSLFGTGY